MNLILIDKDEFNADGRYELNNTNHLGHIQNILHLIEGDFVKIGIKNCQKGLGQLLYDLDNNRWYIQLLPLIIRDIDIALRLIDNYHPNFHKQEAERFIDGTPKINQLETYQRYPSLTKTQINLWKSDSAFPINLDGDLSNVWLLTQPESKEFFTRIAPKADIIISTCANSMETIHSLPFNEPKPMIDIVIQLPSPKTLKSLIQKVCSFGIRKIAIFVTESCSKQYLNSSAYNEQNVNKYILDALSQIRRIRVPQYTFYSSIDPLLGETSYFQKWILVHPYPVNNEPPKYIENYESYLSEGVTVVIGNESGLKNGDASAIQQSFNCMLLSLGTDIKTVEVAAVETLALISHYQRLNSTLIS